MGKANSSLIQTSDSFRLFILFLWTLIILWAAFMVKNYGFPLSPNTLENFSTIFISIVLEAFPFVLIGVLLSSLIQIFITEDMLLRFIPKNRFLAIPVASLTGLFFPICECANVPVARRLVEKGMPLHIAMTFLMSVAIVNPVVLMSTYFAFNGDWVLALLRGVLGMLGAIIIGFVVSTMKNPQASLRVLENRQPSACSCCHEHSHEHEAKKRSVFLRIQEILAHTSSELFAVGRFLILGAFISTFVQTFLPRGILSAVGSNPVLSIFVMMALAYGLSLCSEADAFIARTFVGQFTSGSIMAFMLFGPMIDVKNTLMLLDGFKVSFVVKLAALTSLVCFVFALIINMVGL